MHWEPDPIQLITVQTLAPVPWKIHQDHVYACPKYLWEGEIRERLWRGQASLRVAFLPPFSWQAHVPSAIQKKKKPSNKLQETHSAIFEN